MGRAESEIIIRVLDLALQYGIPAVLEVLEAWGVDEVTDADVDALGAQMEVRDTDRLRNTNED